MLKVIVYKPAKTATQSGLAKTNRWLIKFENPDAKFIEPLMGWTGSSDTRRQITLNFASEDEAVTYAKAKGWDYEVLKPQAKKMLPKSYSENYSFKRVKPFTH